MKLKELIKEIEGTNIQKEAQAKRFIGSDIEIHTDISNIDDYTIDIRFNFNYGTADYDDQIDTDNLSIKIQYDKGKFGAQLLSYSRGDRVQIVATLKRAAFGYYNSYEFELVSIRKLSTPEARFQAEKEAKEANRKSSGCFIATACYGSHDAPEVLVLRQYRDDKLLHTFCGKMVVKSYYLISPAFATVISKSDFLKGFVRKYLLEHLLARLR